jgi:hypothetical protein
MAKSAHSKSASKKQTTARTRKGKGTDTAPNKTIKAIGKGQFDTLVRVASATKRKLKEEREALAGKVAAAAENDRLHVGAFNLFMRLFGMEPLKRAEFLFQFDTYRQYGKLDDSRDLFRRGAAEPDDTPAEPNGSGKEGGAKAQPDPAEVVGRGEQAKSDFSRKLHGGDTAKLN